MHPRLLVGFLCLFACCVWAGCDPDDGDEKKLPQKDAGTSDAADSSSNACSPPSGPGTVHQGTISANETWSAATGPHVVEKDVTIEAGAEVTVEPCAHVQIAEAQYLYVAGKLTAKGDPDRRIQFGQKVSGKRFRSVWIKTGGVAELTNVDLAGGGDLPNQTLGATVVAEGKDLPADSPLFVDGVTVKDSAGYGIVLLKWAGFAAGSKDLAVSGSGAELTDNPFPLRVSFNALATIPSGTYTGNAVDEIQIVPEAPHYRVVVDETIRHRGVPYRVGGNGFFGQMEVGDTGKNVLLTVEPGVTLRFWSTPSNAAFLQLGVKSADGTGRLKAVGSLTDSIVFTGVEPGAGSWEGINFLPPLGIDNLMANVIIEDAGAHGGAVGFGCPPGGGAAPTDGALKIFAEPSVPFLKASTIRASKAHGVFRAWEGNEVDFLDTNTFEGIAGCKQVLPKSPAGSCPASPDCPK
jgi:hypothetical protein